MLPGTKDLDVTGVESPTESELVVAPGVLPVRPAGSEPVVSEGPNGPNEPPPIDGVVMVMVLVLPVALDNGGV